MVRPSVFLYVSLFLFTLVIGARAAHGDELTGVIVDQDARPVPRALVTATDAAGKELARAFTTRDGAFRLDVNTAAGCLLEARLTGFRPTRTDCRNGASLRIVLVIAPLEEVVIVSGTRTETPAGQLAASVTVFTASEIARRQRPMLAELLRASAGTAIVAGVPGALSSLFVRGGESNHTKVLLDGIPLNEPGGTFDLSNVTSSHLGRVELIRGAHSSLFGSDAVAGVVQLFTRRARPGEPMFEASLDGGSYRTVREAVTFGRASQTWDYSLHASRLDTDNRDANQEFGNTTLSASAGGTLKPGLALRAVARGELGRAGTPGQTAFGRADLDAFSQRRNGAAGVSLQHQLSSAVNHAAAYSYSASNRVSSNLTIDPPYTPQFGDRVTPFEFFDFPYDIRNRTSRHHVGYQLDWRLSTRSGRAGEHVVTTAVDWDGERARLEDRLAANVANAARDNFGWTLQHQALWPRVFVTTGLRLEQNDSFGFAAVPRGSLVVIAREGDGAFGVTKLKAAAGAGIKEPTIEQSFSPSPAFPGNPDLEPERSRTFDIGVEQGLFDGALNIEATWFANRFRDLISTRTVSFTPFRLEYFNIGETRARGVEITAHAGRGLPFHVRAGYTLLDSEVLESASANPVFATGNALYRRPRHSGFVDLATDWGKLDISVFAAFVGRAVDSDFSELDPPMTFNDGYRRWDFRAAYELTRRLTATAAIDNLFNADYMEPLGYPALGRAARVGAHVRF
jgi:vitamin B12 transporter